MVIVDSVVQGGMNVNEELLRKLIYHQTINTQALVRVMGMMAENMQRQVLGQSMAYTENDFTNMIDELGIHHNAVLESLESTY